MLCNRKIRGTQIIRLHVNPYKYKPQNPFGLLSYLMKLFIANRRGVLIVEVIVGRQDEQHEFGGEYYEIPSGKRWN